MTRCRTHCIKLCHVYESGLHLTQQLDKRHENSSLALEHVSSLRCIALHSAAQHKDCMLNTYMALVAWTKVHLSSMYMVL